MKTAVVLALLCFFPIMCSPVGKRSTQNKWYKTSPSFLLRLFKKIAAKQTSLAKIGATQVHGFWATVKKPPSTVGSDNVVHILSPINGTNFSFKKVFLVNLHLTIQAKTNVRLQQATCDLILTDIKTGVKITSKVIPCASSSNLVLTVTAYFKNWLANPATNLGIKVVISSQRDEFPVSSLPYVSMNPNVEPPYYILYLS